MVLKGTNISLAEIMIKETKINEAIVAVRFAQAAFEFVMESNKFQSSIVLDDMQDCSDGLDTVANLLMEIRDDDQRERGLSDD